VKRPPQTPLIVPPTTAWEDHAELAAYVGQMLAGPETYFPIAVRLLIDRGVAPVAIGKRLLIGDRAGGMLYEVAANATALDDHERATEEMLRPAWRKLPPELSALWAAVGAAWLIPQCGVPRQLLVGFAAAAWPVRERRADFAGYGAIDLVDNHGGGTREAIIELVRETMLPEHAPLVWRPRGKVSLP
jgi:hypothetical protein